MSRYPEPVTWRQLLADRPPVTPRVGDIVEDPVDLERLPVGSVVLGRDGRAYDHRGYDMWHRSERLGGTVGEYIVPARVLYVPGEQPGSSTDQALAEAWAEGHRTGWEHCQDGNYGNDHWDDPTPNPYAAAARAETTTATTEDAARVINEVLGGDMDNHARIAAHRLADAGLLATARTRPTREQIAAVVHHVGWEVPQGYEDNLDPENCATCRDALNTADAVLALLGGA